MFENQNNNNVQFENQQLGNGFYGDSGVEPVTPGKKGKKIAVVSGITAAALAGGCATAYAVSDTVKNQVKLRTMKPENYYAWVCENNSAEISKNMSSKYAQQLDRIKGGMGVTYNINYEMPDSVKSQLKDAAGDEELSSIIDNIKNISLNMDGSVKGNAAGYNIAASLNGDKLASIDYDLNIDNFDIFLRCPELTEKWVALDIADQLSYDEDAQKALDLYKEFLNDPESILSPADLESEINKYVRIWCDNTKDVKIEKKETINISDISVDYTVAEVHVTPELAKDMAEKYSDAVKNDEVIRNIWVNKLGMDESELNSQLDDFVSEVNTSDSDVTLKTYIDPAGTIRGISMANADGEEAKVIIGKEDTKIRGEFSFSDECKATLTADETADKTYSGTFDVDADGETVKIDFDSIKVVDETNGYTEGNIKITAEDSDVIDLKLSSDGKSQTVDYDINVEGTNYGKLSINVATNKGSETSLPSKDDAFVVSEDNMQTLKLEDYVSQSEVESFLKDIFTKVGLKDADEASKAIAESAFNGGSVLGGADYGAADEFDYSEFEDEYADWDEEDFDWEGEDFDWDDYDFDEEDFNIEIPDVTMPEITIS